jgi:hypothetical protein
LWAELAETRGQVERLAFENRLLWSRASRHVGDPKPVQLAPKHAVFLKQALQCLKDEGADATMRLLDDLETRLGPASIATISRHLAESALERDAAQAQRFAERALSIRPEIATARILKLAATETGDKSARARAGEFILGQGGSYIRPTHVDQTWSDSGNTRPLVEGLRTRPSGVAYPAPVYGRVLMALHSTLPMHRAGYSYRSHALLKQLKALGSDVRCYSRLGFPRDIERLAREEPAFGFEAEDVVDGIRYRRLLGSRALGRGRSPLDSYLNSYADALQMAIRRQRPTLVHTASNYMNAVAGYMAASDARIPFIHEVRGFWELTAASRQEGEQLKQSAVAEAKLEAQAAARADRVLTLSKAMKSELINRGIDAVRIEIVPNGVDPEAFTPIPRDAELAGKLNLTDAPTIGYVGSFPSY